MSNASGKNISYSNHFLNYFHTVAWAISDVDVQSPSASGTRQLRDSHAYLIALQDLYG